MRDKERLEDAKEALKEIDFIKNQRDFKQEEIAKAYFTEKYGIFLIKQAERLEINNERFKALEEMLTSCTFQYDQMLEQNKRYREAIKKALYELPNGYTNKAIMILHQALEESE